MKMSFIVLLLYGATAVLVLCQTKGQNLPPVYLSHASTTYTTNNSQISISDIGYHYHSTLRCHTDLTACCRGRDTGTVGVGEWYYPDGSRVPDSSAPDHFFRVRNNPQMIRLVRPIGMQSGVGPTGLYCCEVPTSLGDQRFCAHLLHCPTLQAPTNGALTFIPPTSPEGENTVATYSCDKGYELSGDSTRTCQSDRTWSSTAASCVDTLVGKMELCKTAACVVCTTRPNIDTCCSEIAQSATCPALQLPNNGTISYNPMDSPDTEDTVATYSCDQGYMFIGDNTRTCQSDGSWSNNTPYSYCAALCPSLPPPTNGMITYTPMEYPNIEDTVATYSCDEGYLLIGDNTHTCQSDRTWSSLAPYCVATCPSPLPLKNGTITFSPPDMPYVENTTATYSCNDSYVLIGDSTLTCQSDRTWSFTAPYCADQAMVQLKFGPTEYCIHWNQNKATKTSTSMRHAIQDAILEGDQSIPMNHIKEGIFSCRTTQNETTYRTTIIGTESASAGVAAVNVKKWVESGVGVRVEWYLVDIDKDCPVHISSLSESECGQNEELQKCVDICRVRGRG